MTRSCLLCRDEPERHQPVGYLRTTADGRCFFRCFVASENPVEWAAVKRQTIGEPHDIDREKEEIILTLKFMGRYVEHCAENVPQ